jgi:hypothetical protein
MGKNQHSKDKLFLTATEWRDLGGGRRVELGAGAAAAYRRACARVVLSRETIGFSA